MHQQFSCSYAYELFFCFWRLKVLIFAFKEVEGFCFYFWMLKVFVFAFREVEGFCCFFLVLKVEGSYFSFLMLKVIAITFGCSKFLMLVLNVESSYSYSWILKVITFVFGC
jgi:hypothetical protein